MTPAGAQHERGFATLLVVLVMVAALVAVGSVLSESALSELEHGYFQSRSDVAYDAVEGCIEDALMRLKRDNGYTGDFSVPVATSTCGIAVGGTNPNRTWSASSTIDRFSPRIDGTMTVSGRNVTLTNWEPYAGF